MRGDVTYCFACREPASQSEAFRIVDRVCHEECFRCHTCRQVLSPRMFCTVLGDIYCQRHHPSYSPPTVRSNEPPNRVCFLCERPVDEPEPLRGPYGLYHGGCFRCTDCRRILSFDRYKVIQSRLYCEPKCEPLSNGLTADDNIKNNFPGKLTPFQKGVIPIQRSKFVKTCHRCQLEVDPVDQVSALDRIYHKECLRCRRCNRVLSEAQYKVIEEFPCCNPDCREDPEVSCTPKSPQDPNPVRTVPIKRSPSPRSKSQPNSSNKPTKASENPPICIANPEKVARLQRKLEQIQSIALEEMNCYVCGKKVYPAERLNMLNRIYHVNCFRCNACNKSLGGGRYQIYKGNPYCLPHYKQLSELRSTSNLNVSSQNVTAERANPVTPFNTIPIRDNPPIQYDTPVIQDESVIFPQHQPEEPLCYVCSKKVYPAEQLNIISRTYHRVCFRCHTCHNQLDVGRFGVIEGQPYCNAHYKQAYSLHAGKSPSKNTTTNVQNSSKSSKSEKASNRNTHLHNGADEKKCYRCGLKVYPTEQLSIMKRLYHRDCFKCGLCQRVLNVGRYGVHDGVPYCTAHYKQVVTMRTASLTSVTVTDNSVRKPKLGHANSTKSVPISKTKCFECKKLTHPINSLILLDRVYHWDCLKCVKCKRTLGRRNYHEIDGLIYCQKDYAEEIVNQDSPPSITI